VNNYLFYFINSYFMCAGNAVDAAVASCLCIGVLNSFSSGIGGGGVMLYVLLDHPWPNLPSNLNHVCTSEWHAPHGVRDHLKAAHERGA
jgi:gamma-glutamyltranspeptidase